MVKVSLNEDGSLQLSDRFNNSVNLNNVTSFKRSYVSVQISYNGNSISVPVRLIKADDEFHADLEVISCGNNDIFRILMIGYTISEMIVRNMLIRIEFKGNLNSFVYIN